jgi:hypothetical protein
MKKNYMSWRGIFPASESFAGATPGEFCGKNLSEREIFRA